MTVKVWKGGDCEEGEEKGMRGTQAQRRGRRRAREIWQRAREIWQRAHEIWQRAGEIWEQRGTVYVIHLAFAEASARLLAIIVCCGLIIFCAVGIACHVAPPPEIPKKVTNPYPTIVWATPEYYLRPDPLSCLNEGQIIKCDIREQAYKPPGGIDAYIFYGTLIYFYPTPRDPKILWALVHEESPRNRPEMMTEKGLNLFNFSATFSRHSDVPMPLLHVENIEFITETRFFIDTRIKNSLLSNIAPVLFIQTDCITSTDRDEYVKELMKYIKIDSYGRCLKNRQLPKGLEFAGDDSEYILHLNDPRILDFLSCYKFIIAIENGVCEDYVTEKLWRSLRIGVVPIYLGPPSIREWLPNPNSAVLLEDYPTPALMAARLYELNYNDTLYEMHLEHKLKRRISNQNLINELTARPYQVSFQKVIEKLLCVVCQRLHENSTRVNMVPKSHYNCPEPISALTLSKNPENVFKIKAEFAAEGVDEIYENIYKTRYGNITAK